MGTGGWTPPKLKRKALVHLHCPSTVLAAETEEKMLTAMGLELIQNPAGCCGVAGAFGYEAGHYYLAMKIGEHDLLPLVGKQDPVALMIFDGFSCRYQMQHGAGRGAMHPAEVLLLARQTRHEMPQHVPERLYLEPAARFGTRDAIPLGRWRSPYGREWPPRAASDSAPHRYGLAHGFARMRGPAMLSRRHPSVAL